MFGCVEGKWWYTMMGFYMVLCGFTSCFQPQNFSLMIPNKTWRCLGVVGISASNQFISVYICLYMFISVYISLYQLIKWSLHLMIGPPISMYKNSRPSSQWFDPRGSQASWGRIDMDGWQTIASKSTPEAPAGHPGSWWPWTMDQAAEIPIFSPIDGGPFMGFWKVQLAAFLHVFNPWLPPKSGWIHAKKIWRWPTAVPRVLNFDPDHLNSVISSGCPNVAGLLEDKPVCVSQKRSLRPDFFAPEWFPLARSQVCGFPKGIERTSKQLYHPLPGGGGIRCLLAEPRCFTC